MTDVITNLAVILIIVIVTGLAVIYIVKEKKKVVQCIGCPAAGTCPSARGGKCSSGCHSNMHTDD